MVVNGAVEPSVVSSATDISRRTDRSGISIPDDGREVTIETERRRRKREGETQSTLSRATNTSLLIEYFENAKPTGSSGHRPSVRVKVTPSAAKRHSIRPNSNGQGLQISEVGSRNDESKTSRRPSHTHRISLAPYKHNVESEDRLTLGEAQRPRMQRSASGDHSTLSSYTSNATDSNTGHPLNVTVIREAGSPGSMISSPRAMDGELVYGGAARRRRQQRRKTTSTDNYYEDIQAKGRRSRSASRGSEMSMEDATALRAQKMSRRRSRSLSRERLPMSPEDREKIERGVRAELEKLKNQKARKVRTGKAYDDGTLKPPRVRQRSRSPDRELDEIALQKQRNHQRKASGNSVRSVRSVSGQSVTNNPALIELIQDTIKRLVLPEIEEIKSHQKTHSKLPPILASGIVPETFSKKPGKFNSMPDVGVPSDGLGGVLAGSKQGKREEAGSRSPMHEREGEGVPLVGGMPTNGILEMPDGPFRSDTPGTNAGTRASILTAKSGLYGLPYPKDLSAMPSSGNTPPPASFPDYPNTHSVVGGDQTTVLSSSVTGDPHSGFSRSFLGPGVPSIASLNVNSEIYEDDDDRRSAASGDSRRDEMTDAHEGASELSFASISVDQSTVLAMQRKERRRKAMEDVNGGEHDENVAKTNSDSVNRFFERQRAEEQERALMKPSPQQMEARRMAAPDEDIEFGPSDRDKVADGRHVYALGANPSVRSTPVLAHSVQPSVIDPSMLDGGSSLSHGPLMGTNANPYAGSPMPDLAHRITEEDEDINTNPSIIQGPIGHQPADWDYDANHSVHDLGITGDRGLNIGLDSPSADRLARSPRPSSHGALTPPLKDEGYMSAANAMGSPDPVSPVQGVGHMGGIDDMLDEDDVLPYRGHRRNGLGSGNSHGMPSPLYDSATGRGIERIESKDIVALMEHLTVRDAQRNARDTEILVTLVRSAAEMRNSFEDMKRHLEDNQRNIIDGVDQNTERSVQKVLQGPRPLPPAAPRRPRYGSEESADADPEASAKRRSVFKRALKGLSMRSSNDLQRIEEMLCHLLDDVEDLKGGQQFYQHSLVQSQSMGTFDNVKGSMPDSQASQQDQSNSFAATSGYLNGTNGVNGEPARQVSQKITFQDGPRQSNPISPINEDEVLVTPTTQQALMRGALATPPDSKAATGSASYENTPTKSSEKDSKEKPTNKRESNSSSLFSPKAHVSRWSQTTASSAAGLKNFLSKKKDHGESEASNSRSEVFNFWDAEQKEQPQINGGSPYASEGQRTERAATPPREPPVASEGPESPINQSNRRSLDIQHPQPRQPHNYRLEMEAQAQQLAAQGAMNNASVSSLGTFPPLGPGGRMQNGKYMSPLAQDAYNQHLEQHQASLNAAAQPLEPPALPPKIREDDYDTSDHSSKRHRKHRYDENGNRIHKPKKERTPEEQARRKEKKERRERERAEGLRPDSGSVSSRKKSRDMLSPDQAERDGQGMSGRTPSSASRLNGPRPLSSNSNRERRQHRHSSSHGTNDTFGHMGIDASGHMR